jgi:hypothetical protein
MGLAKRLLGDLPRARTRLAYQKRLRSQGHRLHFSVSGCEETGLGDPDEFVCEERYELDAVVHGGVANEREMDATGEEALDDLAGGGDFYFYEDVWVISSEAAEGAREEVDAWGGRRADVNRSGLESGERVEFFLGGGEHGEGLARVRCEDAPRVGEPAAATVAFNEPLACSRLEKA